MVHESGAQAGRSRCWASRYSSVRRCCASQPGVASFAGLYYAVAILVDSAYRDQFVDTLTSQLRETFERRAEYLRLLHHREGITPADPSAGT